MISREWSFKITLGFNGFILFILQIDLFFSLEQLFVQDMYLYCSLFGREPHWQNTPVHILCAYPAGVCGTTPPIEVSVIHEIPCFQFTNWSLAPKRKSKFYWIRHNELVILNWENTHNIMLDKIVVYNLLHLFICLCWGVGVH
jgi:hypothetical protein